MTETRAYDWREIRFFCSRLCALIAKDGRKIHCILAVSRGGLIASTILSHMLKVREVDFIQAQSYTDARKQEVLQVELPNSLRPSWNYLVVDDIVDSGATFKHIMSMMDEDHTLFASLIIKRKSNLMNDVLFGQVIDDQVWCQFPWE